MNFLRATLTIRELFFPLIAWAMIYVTYWSFAWFFNEPVNPLVYIMPFAFILSVYFGYCINHKYISFNEIHLQKKVNFLLLALVGFSTVLFQLYLKRANLEMDLASIREQHQEFSQSGLQDTLYSLFFPLVIVSFIVVNFNNLKHKRLVNIVVLSSCIAFIPINGGRVNFLIFGSLYIAIYVHKNFYKIKANLFKNLLRFIAYFIATAIFGSVYGFIRTGNETVQLANYLSTLQHIDSQTLHSLSLLPYNIGFIIIAFINTFYDYTGGNVYYLSIFLDEFHKIEYRTFGFYNFNFLDRFHLIDWNKTHDDIDGLYINHDIKYNVWATFIRDFSIDFGVVGTFIVLVILSSIMFQARKYLHKSYSAQSLYFIIFAFLIFSPFHSLFFLTRAYGVAFIMCSLLFVRYKFINSV